MSRVVTGMAVFAAGVVLAGCAGAGSGSTRPAADTGTAPLSTDASSHASDEPGTPSVEATTTAPRAAATPRTSSAAPVRRSSSVTRVTLPHGDVILAGGIVLPNAIRTPGATNPAVTASTIHRTICRTGYTSTIRPSSSYTTGLKVEQLGSGYAYHHDRDTSDYEEDHLIALELGGSPSSEDNLWPEPYAAQGAKAKDLVENKLHDLVCSGALGLRTAQHAIATNWWRAYQHYGGIAVPRVYDGSYTTATPKPVTSATSGLDPRYDYCYEAIEHGYGPYYEGRDPEYDWYTDADHDGVVCER